MALFQDTTANALTAVSTEAPYANCAMIIPLKFYMVANTISSTTFKIRIGPSDSSRTITINGNSGARTFGGVGYSSITITELYSA